MYPRFRPTEPRRPLPSLATPAALWLSLALAVSLGCGKTKAAPGEVVLVNGHAEAFLVWAEHDARDRILVHVDAHDDFLRTVPAEQLERLGQLVHSRRIDFVAGRLATGESELMDEGNFIHAARHVGQIREIYWVVAFGSRNSPALQHADRKALLEMGFTPAQVRGFRAERGCLVSDLHGTPFRVCGMADLPRFDEPVLLDVDIDLFSILSEQHSIPIVESLRAFGRDLRRSRLRFDIATIARSVEDGYTHLHHTYVADAVRQLLSSPTHDLTAEQWSRLQQRAHAEAQHDARAYDAAIAVLDELLRETPDDPATHYAIARSFLAVGRYGAALEHAELAGRVDPLYELGLVVLAKELAANDHPEAMQFLDRAEAMSPMSPFAARARGDYFYDRGMYRRALSYYSKIDLDGNMDMAMRIGDAYMALEDYEDGMMYYEIGMRIGIQDRGGNRRSYSESWLHLGRYYEHVAHDDSLARLYYDRYLQAQRAAGKPSEGIATLKATSQLFD